MRRPEVLSTGGGGTFRWRQRVLRQETVASVKYTEKAGLDTGSVPRDARQSPPDAYSMHPGIPLADDSTAQKGRNE